MKKSLAALLLLSACAAPAPRPASTKVRLGIDALEADGFAELRGKRIGLIVNQTSRDSAGRSTVDVLSRAPGVTVSAIFTPEHGFAGSSEESKVSNDTLLVDRRSIPIVSLYKGGLKGMRPDQADLVGLDALVFDIQDIGARYFTYLATMGMALEEAKTAGIEFVVLDRPNPINGVAVAGPTLDDPSLSQLTAVAYFPVPIRHGLTAGEMARFHNATVGHPRLTIVPLENWRRAMWFDQTGLPWTAPSPNMPDLDSATLYPGLACFEFMNVSVGRGTPEPFRWIGAPWMKAKDLAALLNAAPLEGAEFEAKDYTPTKSEYAGQLCHGVRVVVKDRDAAKPWEIFVHMIAALRGLNPADLKPNWTDSRKLIGTDRFQLLYEKGAGAREIIEQFEGDARAFEQARKPFLLYR